MNARPSIWQSLPPKFDLSSVPTALEILLQLWKEAQDDPELRRELMNHIEFFGAWLTSSRQQPASEPPNNASDSEDVIIDNNEKKSKKSKKIVKKHLQAEEESESESDSDLDSGSDSDSEAESVEQVDTSKALIATVEKFAVFFKGASVAGPAPQLSISEISAMSEPDLVKYIREHDNRESAVSIPVNYAYYCTGHAIARLIALKTSSSTAPYSLTKAIIDAGISETSGRQYHRYWRVISAFPGLIRCKVVISGMTQVATTAFLAAMEKREQIQQLLSNALSVPPSFLEMDLTLPPPSGPLLLEAPQPPATAEAVAPAASSPAPSPSIHFDSMDDAPSPPRSSTVDESAPTTTEDSQESARAKGKRPGAQHPPGTKKLAPRRKAIIEDSEDEPTVGTKSTRATAQKGKTKAQRTLAAWATTNTPSTFRK